jgi:hypothetical protein
MASGRSGAGKKSGGETAGGWGDGRCPEGMICSEKENRCT